jgi:hypothetical protein
MGSNLRPMLWTKIEERKIANFCNLFNFCNILCLSLSFHFKRAARNKNAMKRFFFTFSVDGSNPILQIYKFVL